MVPRKPSFGLIAITTLLCVVSGSAADSGYVVSVNPAVDTPTKTVTFEGDDYKVSQIGRVEPGMSLSVTVDAPEGEGYDVLLYNSERDILDRHRTPDTDTVSFDIPENDPNYPPGTYVIAVDHDGVFEAVIPVVVSGYRATIEAPESVDWGATIPVEVSLTIINGSKPVERVDIIIGNETTHRRHTLSQITNRTYKMRITIDSLHEGDYLLYGVVHGVKEVFGHGEILGVTDSQSLSIQPAHTSVDTTEASDEATVDGAGGTGSAIETRSSETTSKVELTTTGVQSVSTSAASTAMQTESPTNMRKTPRTRTISSTENEVITPNDTLTSIRTTTPGQVLGFLPVIIAMGLATLLVYRRQ